MDCNQSRDLFSAWVDRQLDSAQRARLEEHLQECLECQAAAERTREVHADLVRAFESPRMAAARVAEQVMAAIPEMTTPDQLPKKASLPQWVSLGLAMALGFLLAVILFRPWSSQREAAGIVQTPRDGFVEMPAIPAATIQAATIQGVARMVDATDSAGVEFTDLIGADWKSVANLPQFHCPSEGSVRTNDNASCEMITAEGSIVRMNSGTEVVFHSAGCVELKRGEIWCRSTPEAPLEVVPALSSKVAQNAVPAGAAPAMSCTASDATCLMSVTESGNKVLVTAAAGNIAVKARNESLNLVPRETATITREGIDRERSSDRLLTTSWMQPLLVRKGHGDGELAARVDDLLAQIGPSEQSALYEVEIRTLGEYAVLPLLHYLKSPRSNSDNERRLVAMRMVSDLAPPWAIGDLIDLLEHPDADVRFLAATALRRLTTQTQGVPLELWRGKQAEWEPAAAAWHAWWIRNRDRYPTHFDGSQRPSRTPKPQSARRAGFEVRPA